MDVVQIFSCEPAGSLDVVCVPLEHECYINTLVLYYIQERALCW